MKKIRRFTLVELLAVIAIIAILSGIGFGAYTFANTRAKESATEALLKQLEAGLEGFHTKNGYYPQSSGKKFATVIFKFNSAGVPEKIGFGSTDTAECVLNYNTTDSPGRKQRLENEIFNSFARSLDIPTIRKHLNADGELEDAWGVKIYYRSPGEFKKGGYDLVSAGPDGEFSEDKKTAADLDSLTVGKFRDDDGTRRCDDLFNF